jgi:hypothetical protein
LPQQRDKGDAMGNDHLADIELADAVEAIRDGLTAATARGTDSALRFELGDIHMEFTVEVRRDARARGGVKAWLVDASAESGRSRAQTHKVSFTLKPKHAATGGGWDIGADEYADPNVFGANES